MSAPVMFLLALATPIVLCLTLLGPAYATILGACYIIYLGSDAAAAQSILDRSYDVFYIIDAYSKLLNYWIDNMGALSILHYALPIAVLPLAGLMLSLWLTRRVASKIFNAFHMSASIH